MPARPRPGRTTRVRCTWRTSSDLPYFANLKAMRAVLGVLREEVAAVGGRLPAYVFLEERLVFLAEGPVDGLGSALDRAWARASEAFAASDRKSLWGARLAEEVFGLAREDALAPLRRLPVERGLAGDLSDYPWAGGDWVVPAQ